MSRVGKLPVSVPQGVEVNLSKQTIVIKGKLGELSYDISKLVEVSYQDDLIVVKPANDTKDAKANWGTVRSNINNMVKGVTEGFEVRLEIFGVGYKAQVQDNLIFLNLGFSHEIIYAIPEQINVICEKPTLIVISGSNKQLVGQIAGEIIKFRPLEPYKGKGVYIQGTPKRKKEGKKK